MNKHLETALEYLFETIDADKLALNTLAMILYLGDWKYALESEGKTISQAVWKKCNNRPYSEDLVRFITNSKHFSVEKPTRNANDWIIKIAEPIDHDHLNDKMKNVIKYVVESSKRVSPDDIVSMTYPMFTYDDDATIDMNSLAQDYLKNVRPNIKAPA